MSRLVRVELFRYFSRRAVRFFAFLAVCGIVLSGVLVFINSEGGEGGLEEARRRQRESVEDCLRFFEEGQGAQAPPPGETPEEMCAQEQVPLEAFDPRFHLTSLQDTYQGTIIPLIILGLAMGATFIGAEWAAGTMTTHLTWESRRLRVHLSKVIAAVIFVGLFAVVMQLLVGLSLLPSALWRGTTAGADGAWFADTAVVLLKGAAVAGLAGAVGFAIASFARNTTAALIVGFVYFAVVENLIRGLRPSWQAWLFAENAFVFITGTTEQIIPTADMSPERSIAVLVGYACALTAATAAVFRARDVT